MYDFYNLSYQFMQECNCYRFATRTITNIPGTRYHEEFVGIIRYQNDCVNNVIVCMTQTVLSSDRVLRMAVLLYWKSTGNNVIL